MTGFLGAFVEAWDEIKIHKMRVMLSLIGVAVSVAAMTAVMAIGQIMEDIQQQMMQSYTGRPATLVVDAWPLDAKDPGTDTGAQAALELPEAMAKFAQRHDITYASRSSGALLTIRQGQYLTDVWANAVDQPFGELRRVNVSAGSWFGPDDDQRLSPPLVVNESFLKMLEIEEFTGPVAVPIHGPVPTTATIIGVIKDQWEWEDPTAYLLFDSYAKLITSGEGAPAEQLQANLTLWVDPAVADEAMARVYSELSHVNGTSYEVSVYREDYTETEDYLATFRLVVTGVGVLIMALAALNLVNIAMVTMRQRIREIGIRRSFGASSTRIFFSVMLESVVATVIAGALGVMAAVVVLKYIDFDWLFGTMPDGVEATFPVGAAIVGMIAATAVGTLSGVIPALTAVRIRPIDAIRY